MTAPSPAGAITREFLYGADAWLDGYCSVADAPKLGVPRAVLRRGIPFAEVGRIDVFVHVYGGSWRLTAMAYGEDAGEGSDFGGGQGYESETEARAVAEGWASTLATHGLTGRAVVVADGRVSACYPKLLGRDDQGECVVRRQVYYTRERSWNPSGDPSSVGLTRDGAADLLREWYDHNLRLRVTVHEHASDTEAAYQAWVAVPRGDRAARVRTALRVLDEADAYAACIAEKQQRP